MNLDGRKYRVGTVDLNVVDQGTGPPVLLLHGFPDSLQLWRRQVPALVQAGYRAIAYDQRGFGQSDAPEGVEHYRIERMVEDALELLDVLGVGGKVRVVGHDWGAVVGWRLAAHFPERVERFWAVSVGHPAAYASAGIEQKLRGWYVLAVQVPGLAEAAIRTRDWALLRRLTRNHPECGRWIADLSRPGRLTAGLNWYRANLKPLLAAEPARVPVPVTGIWSTHDVALTEEQMVRSGHYVDGPWHYERIENASHWIPLDAPERLNQLLTASGEAPGGGGGRPQNNLIIC